MNKKIRCALYDRVSTDQQAEEGLSLQAQKDALTNYALSHGYEIAGYYTDEGITARKKMQNRKELQRLLDDVKKEKIDLILVTKLDRWFRNIKDYHNTQAILEAHSCNWKTIFEEYDTSTSNGRFAINIMLSVNENECDRDSERIKSVFQYKKKKKELLTGVPAYGYKTQQKKLVKDPDTQPVVEEIFRYYFTCFSKRNTIIHIQNKYKETAPTPSQINRILGGSKTYTGELYGIKDYCEPYITEADYWKIKSVSDSKTYAHTCGAYLFSQLVKCPVCGSNLTGFVKKQICANGNVSMYKRYRCAKKLDFSHKSPCITEHVIESFLIQNILEKFGTSNCHLTFRQLSTPLPDPAENIKAELKRLNHMYQKGRISEDYYERQYTCLEKQLKDLSIEQKSRSESHPEIPEDFHGNWLSLYENLDILHKRSFWKQFLKGIYIDPDTHKLCGFEFY